MFQLREWSRCDYLRLERAYLTAVERSTIPYSSSSMEDLRSCLQRTRWPDEISNSNWTYGFDLEFLADLSGYWRDRFDWETQIDRISAFDHYKYQAAEGRVHFIHAKGKGPAPIPLILTHGWPGFFAEMLEIIPLLTDPATHYTVMALPHFW